MKTYKSNYYDPDERWVDIKGYEGYYQVSTFANVRSLDRTIIDKNGLFFRHKGRPLRAGLSKEYPMVRLSQNCKGQNVAVHRLVASAFIPNPENKPEVNHINGVKNDNRLVNLEWVTLF